MSQKTMRRLLCAWIVFFLTSALTVDAQFANMSCNPNNFRPTKPSEELKISMVSGTMYMRANSAHFEPFRGFVCNNQQISATAFNGTCTTYYRNGKCSKVDEGTGTYNTQTQRLERTAGNITTYGDLLGSSFDASMQLWYLEVIYLSRTIYKQYSIWTTNATSPVDKDWAAQRLSELCNTKVDTSFFHDIDADPKLNGSCDYERQKRCAVNPQFLFTPFIDCKPDLSALKGSTPARIATPAKCAVTPAKATTLAYMLFCFGPLAEAVIIPAKVVVTPAKAVVSRAIANAAAFPSIAAVTSAKGPAMHAMNARINAAVALSRAIAAAAATPAIAAATPAIAAVTRAKAAAIDAIIARIATPAKAAVTRAKAAAVPGSLATIV